ncbi:MAG TPA: 2,3-bisphosphoglycerate-independent phosphoglycerate mutase [Stellaceae bacterium]|nr:2,3-bisphosphoglycerate-independent phosphoglycerate mutase [Stellaceae bacterium]
MTAPSRPRPVVLCILDGWGHRAECTDNAICEAETPAWHRFMATCPHAFLQASELYVGLPRGQMGNSEVGHMNIGAGRVVMQDLPRIDQAIADGSLARNPRLLDFITALKKSGGAVHLMGLLSPGGVHSHQDHMAALARLLSEAGLAVRIHAFLDGRDTPPKAAHSYMASFIADIAHLRGVAIATVTGRYYAMDRDKRWDRVEKAYRCLVDAEARRAPAGAAAVQQGYDAGESDEFVLPTAVGDYRGMKDGDGVLMANFRADRVREILAALLDPAFEGFARKRLVKTAAALGMTGYSTALNAFVTTLFPPEDLGDTFAEVISRAGLTQLRIAETEKYAHVTFFFNGGEERPFAGESRILVPSPKVATYDMKPEMSAFEVTDKLVEAIGSGKFDFIVVNYANTDMVGHTGDFAAAKKAVETVDTCLGRLSAAIEKAGGALIITADHGNAEVMVDPSTHQPHTAHTTNRVPVMLVGGAEPGRNAPLSLHDGRLADVAPTLLELLGLPQPSEMTGHTLISHPSDSGNEGARAAE